MFDSIKIIPDSLQERPPKSSLPWVWFGFLFVAAFFIEETLMIALELDEKVSTVILTLIAAAGWIYWLFCVARFHTLLQEATRNQYPISGVEAALKHIIPFYNLFWVFHWPSEMSNYLNRRGRVQMTSGKMLGVLMLISLLIGRLFDGGIGLIGTFAVGMYMSTKLKRHLESIEGVSKDKFTPVFDPSQFRSTSSESVAIDSTEDAPAPNSSTATL